MRYPPEIRAARCHGDPDACLLGASLDDYTIRGGDAFVDLARQIYQRLGACEINVVPGFGGAGHVMGRCAWGTTIAAVTLRQVGRIIASL